jgi:hypothetical protein
MRFEEVPQMAHAAAPANGYVDMVLKLARY